VIDNETEIAARADFSIIRYAQCWEDADTLLAALDIQPGDVCFSVGSGGENSLSLLSRAPRKVVAVDISPAQNACLELKASGFRGLSYPELLELVGVRSSQRRGELYQRVRKHLTHPAQLYWDSNRSVVERGLVTVGKFENYFTLFRRWILPLIHSRRTVTALFEARSAADRQRFYTARWDNWRWRLLCRLFFSRFVMGHLGRDPRFFDYVEGEVAKPVFGRAVHALTEMDPARNPYLQWIACGRFINALPHAWRAENFVAIRAHIDRLEIGLSSVESYLARAADASIDRFNLSDIFEYISAESSEKLFQDIVRCGRPGGRLAYWNMQAPRRCPPGLAGSVHTLDDLSRRLHREAKTFFYSAFYVEELQ
jgi:S-adenosylmethionine:diacylglycerol 3-amino-3-carboxypropyl transferase